MGTVYGAVDEHLGRRVAVKVMHGPLATNPVAAERFLREGRLAAQIRHPHVLQIFDIGVDEGIPFIVMELLEGETLAALLERKGALSTSEIVHLFLPLVSAIGAAHDIGLVHRDLKPGNVMLARRSRHMTQPVILDFGISKMLDEEPDRALTRSESMIGTVHYMSPEQTGGAKFASVMSDQYALGVMLYECATGSRPFRGASPYELMHAIVTSAVTPAHEINSDIPPEFSDLLVRTMHRDPNMRFGSVRALGAALLPFGGHSAWTLWAREFSGNPFSHDIPTSTTSDADSQGDAPAVAAGRRSALRPAPGKRLIPWTVPLGAIVLAAVWSTLLLTRAAPAPSSEVVSSPPPEAAATSRTETARAPATSEVEQPAVADESLAASPAVPTASASSTAAQTGRHELNKTRKRTPETNAPTASTPRPSQASEAQGVEVGHNNALILE